VMISTRGRYALRVLIDLAEHGQGEYIPMKEVAARLGLSLKYLERIVPVLKEHNMVEGLHGKGGGYRLTRQPAEYRVGDILRVMEGELSAVGCSGCSDAGCQRSGECPTMPMWSRFNQLVNDYFDGITLADLMK